MSTDQAFDAALDLLRRLNPAFVKENLNKILQIAPSLEIDLLESCDVPLEVKRCPQSGKEFLCCDYNRDGDSYRSPWSNDFVPALDDGVVPSERVRKMEVRANEGFDVYRELYFEGGVSSVYFWDIDEGFAGCVLLKKGGTIAIFVTMGTLLITEVQLCRRITSRLVAGIVYTFSRRRIR